MQTRIKSETEDASIDWTAKSTSRLLKYEYTLLMPYSISSQCSLSMRTIMLAELIPPNPYSMTDADPTSRSYEKGIKTGNLTLEPLRL